MDEHPLITAAKRTASLRDCYLRSEAADPIDRQSGLQLLYYRSLAHVMTLSWMREPSADPNDVAAFTIELVRGY